MPRAPLTKDRIDKLLHYGVRIRDGHLSFIVAMSDG